MRFDLTDLRLFTEVADAGSLTLGAERAHLALASASARIRGMEDTLGVPLLERLQRGVRPTPAGQALLHHARVLLQQAQQMRGDLAQYARGLKGHVRLLSNTAALSEFLPRPLASFLAAHPNVDIALEEKTSLAVALGVSQGLADIGIASSAADLAELRTYPFQRDRLVLVVPARHRLGRRKSVAFEEALDEPWVALGLASALQAHLAQRAQRLGRSLSPRVRMHSFDGVCAMVEQGVGVSVLPEAACRRFEAAMRIRALPLSDDWSRRELLLCVREPEALPAHARQLLEHLRASAAR